MKENGKIILYLHRTQAEGAEGSHIRGMVDGFRENGAEVSVLGPPGVDPYEAKESLGESEDGKIRKVFRFFADHAPQVVFELAELLFNFPTGFRVFLALSKERPSFIYERYALNNFAGVLSASLMKIPIVLEVNDATVIERSRPLVLSRLARSIEAWALRRATLIVTISNHFRFLLSQNFDIAKEKILVLPNAINEKDYFLEEEKKLARKDYGIPAGATVLGCVGAFVPWHGLQFLVESVSEVVDSQNLFFFFIGDGPVRPAVEDTARRLGLAELVVFTGFVPACKIPYLLELVDICVIPQSNDHCSPMKLFEYMAARKPIILPSFPPLLDTITDEKEGIFFAPNDHEGLKNTICRLSSSHDLRQELGKKAWDRVTSQYTWHENSMKVLQKMVPSR